MPEEGGRPGPGAMRQLALLNVGPTRESHTLLALGVSWALRERGLRLLHCCASPHRGTPCCCAAPPFTEAHLLLCCPPLSLEEACAVSFHGPLGETARGSPGRFSQQPPGVAFLQRRRERREAMGCSVVGGSALGAR